MALEATLRLRVAMPNTVEVEAAAHQTRLATLASLAVRLSLAQAAAVREEPVAAVLVTLVEPGAVMRLAEAVLLAHLAQMVEIILLDAEMVAAVVLGKPQVQAEREEFQAVVEVEVQATQVQAVKMEVPVAVAKSGFGRIR